MIKIHLLQTLAVSIDGDPPVDLGSPKARALFAYLVLHRGQSLDRRRLAFQLWARASETAARRNLRQYLHRLRRSLEAVDPDGAWIIAEGNYVRFEQPPNCEIDVAQFEAAVTPPNENLDKALTLYTGELLSDVYDDWVVPERKRLARLYRECLLRLSERAAVQQRWEEAIGYADLLLNTDPLVESSHVRLMKLYHAAQERARLVQHFAQMQALFETELGLEPSAETTALYNQLLSNDVAQPPPPVQVREQAQSPAEPFVGRQQLLAELNQARASAYNGHGSVLLVRGEMGVGKTRLVSEWLAQQADTFTLLQATAYEFEIMIPYAPLREALNSAEFDRVTWDLLRPPPPWLPALQPLIPDLAQHYPDLNNAQSGNPIHLIQAIGSFLFTLSRQRPIVLLLDNLHWADGETWNLVAYLAKHCTTHRLLVLATVRDEDISPEASRLTRRLVGRELVNELQVGRFSAEETQELVQLHMPDRQLDPQFIRRLFEETQGNPFFIVETVQAVQEAGGDWTEQVPTDKGGNRPNFAIPLKVQTIIETRLDQLPEESRMALSVAAAIGRAFTFTLLQQVSGLETHTLLDALDDWLTKGLVRERHASYTFAHEQLVHVAYDQLSRARRQWIHLQIGNYLVEQPNTDPAQLAHHFYQSSEPANALPYLIEAGQRALSVRSYAAAREYGQRAIGLSGRFPTSREVSERLDLNLQLAQAYAFSGSIKQALDLLQETERLAEREGDMHRLTHIFYKSSQLFWLRGMPERASTYARRMLRHAEELQDNEMRLASLRMLGRTSIARSEFDDAIAFLLRYSDLNTTDAMQPDLPVVYGYLGVAYARVGSWQRAIDSAQRGVDLASVHDQGATHVVACMQQAFIYAELREWETALAVLQPVRETWREAGMSPHAYMMRVVLGRCLAETGEIEEGLGEIRAAIEWAESVDHRVFTHNSFLMYAQALLAANHRSAYPTANQAQLSAENAGDRWAQAVALRTQATIDMRNPHKTDWPQAEKQLLEAMALLRQIRARPDLAHTYLMLRRLYDRAGQSAWAIDCHFRAITIFEELGMESELSIARGQASGERTGAVVIPGLALHGPTFPGI